jgi:tetratricopeptide (TPR) repeat protein
MAVAVHIRVRALLSAAVHATTSYEPLSLGGFSSSFCPRLKSKITISMTQPEDADADADAIWEAIEHGREALAACPEGHPDRGQLAADLGMILYPGYCRFGDITLIKEGIKVQREVLDLCPRGHPDRSPICANLGVFLCEYYTQSGDIAVLDEAIELQREALVLLPPDHPDREFVCTSLGKSLHTRYGQCSDINLLDKAIELLREALKLRPPGHLMRAASCEILAASIYARYKQCDNTTFLDEAIELGQEALILRPSSHPLRATTLGHFGCFLHSRFEEGGRSDLTLLNKAIELDREALALQPAGHPSQASSLANLGSSLHTLFEHCGDVTLLNEAVELKRAALALQPLGHPDRSNFCTVLSTSLIKAYKQTKDAALLDEVIELCGYASRSAAPWQPMHALLNLAEIHLIPDTSYFSLAKALQYLDLSFPSHVDQIQGFISHAIYTLSQHWSLDIVMTAENILLLCQIYVKIIDRLPLAAGFVLDTSSRLQTLKSRHYIGTDACVVAALANQPSKAVELLDRAHGLVWTQALHQRDPQIEGAPSGLASELAVLLREISAPLTTQPGDLSYAHHQDRRYRQSTRIQALLREIRAMPGVERFMLGKTYDTLRAAAREHPVVVLAAGRGHAFALIMSSATEDQPRALHLDLTSDDLQSIQSAAQDAGLRSRADIREGDGLDARIGYKTSGLHVHHKPFRVLAKIWHKIVKPVIDYLKLEVCILMALCRVH